VTQRKRDDTIDSGGGLTTVHTTIKGVLQFVPAVRPKTIAASFGVLRAGPHLCAYQQQASAKEETFTSLLEAKVLVEGYMSRYNQERWHSALDC
jgi:hypothetical protein